MPDDELASVVIIGRTLGLSHHELVVGNGACELIKPGVPQDVHRLAVPVPTFEEFVNRAKILGGEVRPFEPSQRFELDIDAFLDHTVTSLSRFRTVLVLYFADEVKIDGPTRK